MGDARIGLGKSFNACQPTTADMATCTVDVAYIVDMVTIQRHKACRSAGIGATQRITQNWIHSSTQRLYNLRVLGAHDVLIIEMDKCSMTSVLTRCAVVIGTASPRCKSKMFSSTSNMCATRCLPTSTNG